MYSNLVETFYSNPAENFPGRHKRPLFKRYQ